MVESLGRVDVDEASAAKRTGSGGGGDVVASCSSSIVDDAGGAAVTVELRLLLFPRVLIIPALTDLRTAGGSGGGGGDRAVDEEERIRSGVGAGAPAHSPAEVAILAARFRRAWYAPIDADDDGPASGRITSRSNSNCEVGTPGQLSKRRSWSRAAAPTGGDESGGSRARLWTQTAQSWASWRCGHWGWGR